jgi:hypothetical protein
MGPLVGRQVEPGHGGTGQGLGGVDHLIGWPGQGEDGPVVVRVGVEVPQARAGGLGQL